MKVYTNIKFTGYWPIGVAAVIVARSKKTANNMLNQILMGKGLPGDAQAEDMKEIKLDVSSVRILGDGNY